MSDNQIKWYILQVYSGYENSVSEAIREKLIAENLDEEVEDIVVPMKDVTTIKKGKKVTMKKNFLPGYILIKMNLKEDVKNAINGIERVSSFLGGKKGFAPISVSNAEVDRILNRIEENVEKITTSANQFEVGEKITISEGPFTSFSGVIEEVDILRSRLKIAVSIFERMVPVEAEFHQVEKVGS